MIRAFEEKDYSAVIALWQEAFGDTEADIATCMRHFAPYTMLYTETDTVLGMFILLPLQTGSKKGDYIYAVATAKSARGRGIATQLLDYAKTRVKDGRSDFLTLVPAKASLFAFYKNRGFTNGSPVSRLNYSTQGSAKASIAVKHITANEMYKNRNAYFKTLAAWDERMLAAIDEIYGGCFYTFEDKGFCTAYPMSDKVIVSELCLNDVAMEDALEALCAYFGKEKIEAVVPDANGNAFAMFYPAEAANMYFNIAIN